MIKIRSRYDKNSIIKELCVPIIFFSIIIFVFLISLNKLRLNTLNEQKINLERAIHKGIILCYALEGYYPPNLEYLGEHYAIQFNEDQFFVDYQIIASNLMPDVTVLIKDK